MKYRHTFKVNAPLNAVKQFHTQSSSMGAITPPPVFAQVHQAPAHLSEGDEMDFTLWMTLLPIRWTAKIENVTATGFTDRQIRGPFKKWVHRHSFVSVDRNTTEGVDEIESNLRPHILWGPVGLGMQVTLPFLFAYRGWKTRRILEATKLEHTYVH